MDRKLTLTIDLNENEIQALEKAGYTKETSIKEMLANAIHDILNSDLEKTVETNIGAIPKEDYDQYVLEQYGFSSQTELNEEALEIEWGDEARYRECELEKRCAFDIDNPDTYPIFQGIVVDYKTARGFRTYYDYLYQYGESHDKFMLYNIYSSNKDMIGVSIDCDYAENGYVSFEIPTYKLNVKQNGGISFGQVVYQEFERHLQNVKDYDDVAHLTELYFQSGEFCVEYNGRKLERIRDDLNGVKYYGFEISKDGKTEMLARYVPEADLYIMSGKIYDFGGGYYRLETNNNYIAKAFQEVSNKYCCIEVKHFGKLFSEQEKQFIENTYDLIKTEMAITLYIPSPTMKWIEKMDSVEVKEALIKAYNAVLELCYSTSSAKSMKYYQNSDEGYSNYINSCKELGIPSKDMLSYENWNAHMQSEQMNWVKVCKMQLSIYKDAAELLDQYKIRMQKREMPIEAIALISENELIKKAGIMADRDSLLSDAENAVKHSAGYPFRYEEENGSYIDYEIVSVNENGTVDIGVKEGNYVVSDEMNETRLITVSKEEIKGKDVGKFLEEKIHEYKHLKQDHKIRRVQNDMENNK